MTKECEIISNDLHMPRSRFDSIIEVLIAALLIFMPLAFGAVQGWSEEVVVFLSGTITLLFLLKLVVHPNIKFIWTWAYIPMVFFIVISIFQLIPLPANLISAISPHTAELKADLLGDLPNSRSLLKSMTISFYPHATKHNLRLLLAIASVFVVVINVFRHPSQIKRLLLSISLIGGGIVLITLIQRIFGNGKIYGFVPGSSNNFSGPFVSYSHYSQFMNLSIGASLGWLYVKVREDFRGSKINLASIFDYFSSSSARMLWVLIIIISLGAATIFISMSRGGMISLLAAMAFTTIIFISRKPVKGNGWIMVVLALSAFICVLYLGFDSVYDRLSTLGDISRAENGRLQILKDIGAASIKFPIFGTGLGTHSVVYPMFDTSTISPLAWHAENEYAQVLEETGFVGLGSLLVFGIIIWLSYARNVRRSNLPICLSAYGLGFGLLAILIHSLSDFGQHLPANAILSVIFCALLLSLTQISRNNTPKIIPKFLNPWLLVTVRFTIFVLVSGIMLWSFVGSNNLRIAEGHWSKALRMEKKLRAKNWEGTDSEYTDLLSHILSASNYQPENVHYRYWLSLYRWYEINQQAYTDTGILPKASIPLVQNIIDELYQARVLCPTFGPVYRSAGTLEMFVLNEYGGAENIRKGFRLAPCDSKACFSAGYLDVIEGKIDESLKKFKRAVQLNSKLFKDVVDTYVNKINRPDLAVVIAGENIGRLSYVINTLANSDEHNELIAAIRAKSLKLLKAKCDQPDASASQLVSLARIYMKEQDNEKAIACYRRALVQNYGQIGWRLTLAGLLVKTEKIPEAMHEARICLRLHPQLKAAKKLIADLSVHPKILNSED